MNGKCIAVIPARGGSKRIPRKNIRPFCGKPMIAWPIHAARASGLFDAILVSTEDEEVAGVAAACGAQVPFRRPADLANDHAGIDEVLLHGIQAAEELYGPVAYACCIYATAPFLSEEYLQQGLNLLRLSGAAAAISVTTFPSPAFRAMRVNEGNRLAWQWPEFAETRSQDLPESFHDAGQFYWVDAGACKIKPDGMFDTVPVVLPRRLVQDIDTPEDWQIAESRFLAARSSELDCRQ